MKLPSKVVPWFWGTLAVYSFDNGYGAVVVDKDDGSHPESGGFYRLTVVEFDKPVDERGMGIAFGGVSVDAFRV